MLYKKYFEEFIVSKFPHTYNVLGSIFHQRKIKIFIKCYGKVKLNIFNTLIAEAAHKACE